jgi:hypothetical protein
MAFDKSNEQLVSEPGQSKLWREGSAPGNRLKMKVLRRINEF